MSKKRISSLEKIGYIKTLPKNADIDNYERLLITKKDGKAITLYKLNSVSKRFDDTTNFDNSWEIFNDHLN